MTVNFPSGRSTSMPLRLFWRAPRISMQSFGAGVTTRSLFPIFEPTIDSSKLCGGSQIFRGAHAVACSGRPLADRFRSVANPVSIFLYDMARQSLGGFGQRPKTARGPRALPGNVKRPLHFKPRG